jgi:hypothetical protein
MFKYATSLFLASICGLGCRNVGPKMGTETHLALSSQSAMATLPNQSMANSTDSTLQVDSAKKSLAEAKTADKWHAPVDSQKNASNSQPEESWKGKRASGTVLVAVAFNALRNAFYNAARQVGGAVLEAEEKVSHSVVAIVRATTISGKRVEAEPLLAHQYRTAATPDQSPEDDAAKKVWYCVAWIGGAVFTCILAPLVVEFIKLRVGSCRHQCNLDKPPQRGDSTGAQRC